MNWKKVHRINPWNEEKRRIEDIVEDLDLASARWVNQEHKRINVNFLAWVVDSLDREATLRQSIIKVLAGLSAFGQRLLTPYVMMNDVHL